METQNAPPTTEVPAPAPAPALPAAVPAQNVVPVQAKPSRPPLDYDQVPYSRKPHEESVFIVPGKQCVDVLQSAGH